MILNIPSTSTGNTAAVAASPTAPATPSPFDAILSLESLAATCAALDVSPLGGGALEGSPLQLDESSDLDSDDGEDSDGEGPLAFLAGLLNVAMAVPAQSPAAPQGDAIEDGIDDVLSGAARQAPMTAGQPAPTATDLATTADAASANDVAAANKLMAGMEAVIQDAHQADASTTQDSTSALARAAEFLSQGARHAPGAVRDTIPTPAHSPRWAEDMGARVALMVRGGESSASLQLTPVDLGPVEVSVTVRDSQASVHFGAAQAETRALLEASIPRLREMLAAQGFNLMDASVSQGFARQARPDAPAAARSDAEPEATVHATKSVTLLGLLDTYA